MLSNREIDSSMGATAAWRAVTAHRGRLFAQYCPRLWVEFAPRSALHIDIEHLVVRLAAVFTRAPEHDESDAHDRPHGFKVSWRRLAIRAPRKEPLVDLEAKVPSVRRSDLVHGLHDIWPPVMPVSETPVD